MLFPIIRVKDTGYDREHIVGTDTHDCLYINNNGRIAYSNLQNGGGLDDWYHFAGSVNESNHELYPIIEFVTFEELMKIYNKQRNESNERKKLRQKIAELVFPEE